MLDIRDVKAVGEADGKHQEAGEKPELHVQAPLAVHAGHHPPVVDHV